MLQHSSGSGNKVSIFGWFELSCLSFGKQYDWEKPEVILFSSFSLLLKDSMPSNIKWENTWYHRGAQIKVKAIHKIFQFIPEINLKVSGHLLPQKKGKKKKKRERERPKKTIFIVFSNRFTVGCSASECP